MIQRRSRYGNGKPATHVSSEIEPLLEDPQLTGMDTLARTKQLILAAVRVWELKRGIHN
jgi:hypothetical protein